MNTALLKKKILQVKEADFLNNLINTLKEENFKFQDLKRIHTILHEEFKNKKYNSSKDFIEKDTYRLIQNFSAIKFSSFLFIDFSMNFYMKRLEFFKSLGMSNITDQYNPKASILKDVIEQLLFLKKIFESKNTTAENLCFKDLNEIDYLIENTNVKYFLNNINSVLENKTIPDKKFDFLKTGDFYIDIIKKELLEEMPILKKLNIVYIKNSQISDFIFVEEVNTCFVFSNNSVESTKENQFIFSIGLYIYDKITNGQDISPINFDVLNSNNLDRKQESIVFSDLFSLKCMQNTEFHNLNFLITKFENKKIFETIISASNYFNDFFIK